MRHDNPAIGYSDQAVTTGRSRSAGSCRLVLFAVLLLAAGCSTRAFIPPSESATAFTQRAVTQSQGAVTVSAAVPSAEEVRALLGVDLYKNDIQPVWLRAENNGDKQVRIALWSLDPEYFSPMEVAWNYRRHFGSEGRRDLERWLYENQMPRRIAPGKSLSGFVFTHRSDGTKGFNVDLYGTDRSYNFTFFVPLPGFRPDYMDVDFRSLYQPDEIRDVDLSGIASLMESFDCCSSDQSGELQGDPFNVVLVGSPLAVRRTLLRAAWQETRQDDPETAVARTNYFAGRPPDGVFLKARPDGDERKQLRLWMAPIRVDGHPLWLGQISYNMSGVSWLFARDQYKIDPDIDDARMFLVQNFWYSQSLSAHGFVGGIPAASIDAPIENFEGHEYFTDGLRSVLVLSETPIALDETKLIDLLPGPDSGVAQ